jgi:hypothetical protein
MNRSADETWRKDPSLAGSNTPGEAPARRTGGAGPALSASIDARVNGRRLGAEAVHAMQVQVETHTDERGVELLRRLRFDSRVIEVTDTLDQWHGADYRYVKVRSGDGSTYVLRHDDVRGEWELTMYQSPRSEGAPSISQPAVARN